MTLSGRLVDARGVTLTHEPTRATYKNRKAQIGQGAYGVVYGFDLVPGHDDTRFQGWPLPASVALKVTDPVDPIEVFIVKRLNEIDAKRGGCRNRLPAFQLKVEHEADLGKGALVMRKCDGDLDDFIEAVETAVRFARLAVDVKSSQTVWRHLLRIVLDGCTVSDVAHADALATLLAANAELIVDGGVEQAAEPTQQ
jgi:hypothetical protein